MIKVLSLARKHSDEIGMEELFDAQVSIAAGLDGDLSALSANGEVSVLSKESWLKSCHETDVELPWLAAGSNLYIKGFEFLPTDIGRSLRIGETVLEIMRENLPPPALENQSPALHESLSLGWRGGVICKVLRSGNIKTGDDIHLVG